MIILGIETSCDETGAALIEGGEENEKVKLLFNVVASSLPLHKTTGGIIPEIAAREQVKYIIPVIKACLEKLKNPKQEIDAIAVTVGPGLIGSLLVGVETARAFSYIWKKPIIPVNHLFGHIYANWIESKNKKNIAFPVIALIVSGGHTDLVLIRNHKDIKWLGGTRDDAAGEAFDKTGRLLDLPYPGGPYIEKMAEDIKNDVYNFPRPMINSGDFDFSFSGLKTAVLREVEKIGIEKLNENVKRNISFSMQEAIFDVLIKKTLSACKLYGAKSILLGGGVAANQKLRDRLEKSTNNELSGVHFHVPPINLCTDNGAMIAAAAFFNHEEADWKNIKANPELYFD